MSKKCETCLETSKRSSKYARTTITNEDGTIAPARINIETGEVKPYKHWKKIAQEEEHNRVEIKGSMSDGSKPYHWEIIPAPDYSFAPHNRVRKSRKTKDNTNNVYLKDYMTLSQAKEELPQLDNIFTGATHLETGNDKPLNQGLMFNMLRDLDVINVRTVSEYTGFSERYCYKLVSYLNIISRAFDAEIER